MQPFDYNTAKELLEKMQNKTDLYQSENAVFGDKIQSTYPILYDLLKNVKVSDLRIIEHSVFIFFEKLVKHIINVMKLLKMALFWL